jgi:hypothetical protein
MTRTAIVALLAVLITPSVAFATTDAFGRQVVPGDWVRMAQAAPAPAPAAVSGPEPVALVEAFYRSGDPTSRGSRAQFFSRELLRLIEADERNSQNEPGNLDYNVLSGDQDSLTISNLRVTEVSRQQNRAVIRVTFRNTAFRPATNHSLTYQLQAGDRGWRITNIIYSREQNLLLSLR